MKKSSKEERLAQAGWKTGSVQEFLDLSDEEMALIEFKRSLIRLVRETRETNQVTQQALARLVKSSQSRIAKLEGVSSDISLDLIVRALFALGITPQKLGKYLQTSN